jgi:hypothetical protein
MSSDNHDNGDKGVDKDWDSDAATEQDNNPSEPQD